MKRKIYMIALAMVCILGGTLVAEAAQFKDVKPNFWAYKTIMWGVNQGIVKGYQDGTFKPNAHLTEAQFLAMLIRSYDKSVTDSAQGNGMHWADNYYSYAKDKNWPTLGEFDKALRDKPITRERVAEVVVGAHGYHFVEDDAIQFMLNTGLSKGRTAPTIDGYGRNDFLTRAQAVQFIKNIKDSGLAKLEERPLYPTPRSEMPEPKQPEQQLPEHIQKVKDYMEKVVQNYPGYTVAATENSVVVMNNNDTNNRPTSVGYSPATSEGESNSIITFQALNDDSVKLTVEMMKAVGLAVNDSFFDVIRDAALSGKDSEYTISGYKVWIYPHPTNPNNVSIDFKK